VKEQKPGKPKRKFDRRLEYYILTLIIFGLVFCWHSAHRIDKEMRHDLLLKTALVAQSIDVGMVDGLSGTEADRHDPKYLEIKNNFQSICTADPKFHFI